MVVIVAVARAVAVAVGAMVVEMLVASCSYQRD